MHWSATANEDPEIFTKTSAYNFLKSLFGIPKKRACINKALFKTFFKENEYYSGFVLKIPEDKVKDLFENHNIVSLNKQYYEANKFIPASNRSFSEADLFKLLDEKVQDIASSLHN